jgi:spermidine synthase
MARSLMTPDAEPADRIPGFVIYPVFLVSGAAAILYQIVWQRSLFRFLGTSMESVTMIVTAFMLGLGLGSLAGGVISEKSRTPLALIFGLVELGIGAFGLVSLPLFTWIAAGTSEASGLAIGLIAFAAVLVPTLLMGGTLPILVAYLVRQSRNVGKSVGMLYFINTVGSAAGCFAAAAWVLGAFGQEATVRIAAATNLLVATVVILVHLARRRPA